MCMTEEVIGRRKDFPQYIIDICYEKQQGQCNSCGNAINKGFYRDHIDGDHSNITLKNLQLLCGDCHRTKTSQDAQEKWKNHKAQEQRVLNSLNKLIDEVFTTGKLGGPILERMETLLMDSLKVSKSLNEIDKGMEYPPSRILMAQKIAESKMTTEAYVKGVMEGAQIAVSLVASKATSKNKSKST